MADLFELVDDFIETIILFFNKFVIRESRIGYLLFSAPIDSDFHR